MFQKLYKKFNYIACNVHYEGSLLFETLIFLVCFNPQTLSIIDSSFTTLFPPAALTDLKNFTTDQNNNFFQFFCFC